MLAHSILQMILPKSAPIYYFGRLMFGCIYGVTHVTITMHAADNSAREIRGTILRSVAYSNVFIFLVVAGMSIMPYIKETYMTNRMILDMTIGMIHVVAALLVLILTHFCTFNSLTQLLDRSHNEYDILTAMLTIRNERNQRGRTLNELNQMKLMMNEDKMIAGNIFSHGNLTPLLLVIGARVLSVLINNIPVLVFITPTTNIVVVYFFKFIFGWITIVTVADRIGLNRFFYVGGIIWGLVTHLLMALLSMDYLRYTHEAAMTSLLLGYTLISMGIEAISYNQLSEAFPLTKRAWSIVFVTFVETVVHFIILMVYVKIPYMLLISVSIGVITVCCYLLKLMPNTHGETLRRARSMFNHSISRYLLRGRYEMADISIVLN